MVTERGIFLFPSVYSATLSCYEGIFVIVFLPVDKDDTFFSNFFTADTTVRFGIPVSKDIQAIEGYEMVLSRI